MPGSRSPRCYRAPLRASQSRSLLPRGVPGAVRRAALLPWKPRRVQRAVPTLTPLPRAGPGAERTVALTVWAGSQGIPRWGLDFPAVMAPITAVESFSTKPAATGRLETALGRPARRALPADPGAASAPAASGTSESPPRHDRAAAGPCPRSPPADRAGGRCPVGTGQAQGWLSSGESQRRLCRASPSLPSSVTRPPRCSCARATSRAPG